MILTPHFVFLHLHKSGGTFANEFLIRFVAGAKQVGYHLPRSLIPAPYAHLPILGFVRNPWSYYVSWYSFQRSRPQPNALFQTLSQNGSLDFARTIERMLNLADDGQLLDEVLNSLPNQYTGRGLNLPAFALAPIRDSGLGFFSYLFRYMFGTDTRGARIERMEQLRETLPSMLDSVGVSLSPEALAYLQNAPRANTSEHSAVPSYYDARLNDLVRRKDALVIDRFGYSNA
ncbi:MAG TPA: hypothetical protein VFS24_20555 [Steroidobacteraceae bacterium]|nr:hypothetical protein [Steroidobacteraceae bacterium]